MKYNYLVCITFWLMLLVMFSSCDKNKNKILPIYNPADFKTELVDKSVKQVNLNHTVADFNLINQNGQTITQEDYKNKIYVVDFFFTRCGTICPIMTDNMAKIQKEFLNSNEVMLLSISVTPIMDSVSVLRDYANKKGVNDAKWNVTTGNKKHIYNLARKSYFSVVEKGDGGLQDFIHTPNFTLIDKNKQIRGIYDGTNEDDINLIINDIKVLQN